MVQVPQSMHFFNNKTTADHVSLNITYLLKLKRDDPQEFTHVTRSSCLFVLNVVTP